MTLTPAQKKSPFRSTSTGLVIERSLASGREEDWIHWWDNGTLAKAMKRDSQDVLGVLSAAAKGFSAGGLAHFWLERVLSLVPPNFLKDERNSGWACDLNVEGLLIAQRHGVNLFATTGGSEGGSWAQFLNKQVVYRSPGQRPLNDQELAARVGFLQQLLKDAPQITPWQLTGALSRVWRALDIGVGGEATELALDTLACQLIEKGAAAIGERPDSKAMWVQRFELMDRRPHLQSLSPAFAQRLLDNLPEGESVAPSIYKIQEGLSRWPSDPQEQAVQREWFSRVDPWLVKYLQGGNYSPPRNRNKAYYESGFTLLWSGLKKPAVFPPSALSWLKEMTHRAQRSPAPYEWFEALAGVVAEEWSQLPKDKAPFKPKVLLEGEDPAPEHPTQEQVVEHVSNATPLLVEVLKISRASNNDRLLGPINYCLEQWACQPEGLGSLAINTFMSQLGETSAERMEYLGALLGHKAGHRSGKWEEQRWWVRVLCESDHVEWLLKQDAPPAMVAASWVSLMDPPSSVDLVNGQLSLDQKKLLQAWPLSDTIAINQMWDQVLRNQNVRRLAPFLSVGLPEGPMAEGSWKDLGRGFEDSFRSIRSENAGCLLEVVDELKKRGWPLVDEKRGNVLAVLMPLLDYPGTLLKELVARGATGEGLDLNDLSDRPCQKNLRHFISHYQAQQLSERLDGVLEPQWARSTPKVRM